MDPVTFSPTSDSSIVAVDGLSTDNALVQAIGQTIATSGKPGKAKYFQFRDGVYDVIKNRGGEGYRIRAQRSTSSTPSREIDPMEAFRNLEGEMAKKRAIIAAGLDAKIAGLREELAQAEQAKRVLLQTASEASHATH